MQGRYFIMKKLNREKKAFTEEHRKELEAAGYSCIGVREPGEQGGKAEPEPEAESEKPDEKAGTGKVSGKKTRAEGNTREGGKDGSGTDNAGKD